MVFNSLVWGLLRPAKVCKRHVHIYQQECSALWGEREQVVWSTDVISCTSNT